MAKTQTKEATPDLLQGVDPKHVEIREGSVKKNLNDPPTTKRPPAPKSQVAPKAKGTEVAKVEPMPEPANIMVVIARAAADPRCDPDKMRALLTMKQEIDADEAKKSFTTDFIALQNALPVIDAKGRIIIEGKVGKKGQNTPYATFNEIHRITKPLLKQHGFALSFATEPLAGGERLIIKGYLDHVGGHQRTTAFPLPAESSGSKNNAQAWGSSFSYGKRYCTIALLNIVSHAPEDADDDGHAADKKGRKGTQDTAEIGSEDSAIPKVNAEQLKAVSAAIEACGVGEKKFCNHYAIDKVEHLPAHQYEEAMQSCRDYGAKKGATK